MEPNPFGVSFNDSLLDSLSSSLTETRSCDGLLAEHEDSTVTTINTTVNIVNIELKETLFFILFSKNTTLFCIIDNYRTITKK